MTPGALICFVCAQAMQRMPELTAIERGRLLDGLKLMLPRDEFEQCSLIEKRIQESEEARRRTDDAQMVLREMLAESKP